jgi:hypothetical protein
MTRIAVVHQFIERCWNSLPTVDGPLTGAVLNATYGTTVEQLAIIASAFGALPPQRAAASS